MRSKYIKIYNRINSDYNSNNKMNFINHPFHKVNNINNMNNNSNMSTNESNDCEEVNRRFLTPKNINNFDRNWIYTQQRINFNNPSLFNNNNVNCTNQTNAYEDL